MQRLAPARHPAARDRTDLGARRHWSRRRAAWHCSRWWRASPVANPTAPVRSLGRRSFTVTGAGTVVTGTLPEGTVRVDDVLDVSGTPVRVRGLQVHGASVAAAHGPTRLAVNLRAVGPADVPRGSALTTPGTVRATTVVDVLLHPVAHRLPTRAVLHVGTAAAPVRARPLGDRHARLTLEGAALPLALGDRVLLRDAGAHQIVAGADVLAVDPAAVQPPRGRRPTGRLARLGTARGRDHRPAARGRRGRPRRGQRRRPAHVVVRGPPVRGGTGRAAGRPGPHAGGPGRRRATRAACCAPAVPCSPVTSSPEHCRCCAASLPGSGRETRPAPWAPRGARRSRSSSGSTRSA